MIKLGDFRIASMCNLPTLKVKKLHLTISVLLPAPPSFDLRNGELKDLLRINTHPTKFFVLSGRFFEPTRTEVRSIYPQNLDSEGASLGSWEFTRGDRSSMVKVNGETSCL